MSTAAAKPKRSRGKRMLRGLLWGSLGLVLAAVCLWIFRQPLLVPLIRPRLEAALATLLRAERVSIGALDGDWITSLDAKDITVENAGIPLRNVRGLRIEASFSLVALLSGDLSGLRTGKVTVAHAELDLRPVPTAVAAAAAPPAPGHSASPTPRTAAPSYEPLLDLCSAGATVHIENLHLRAARGERLCAFTFALDPDAGIGSRHLVFAFSGLAVDARILPPVAGDKVPRVEARVDAEDPGAMLDLFGLGAGVREGRLQAVVLGALEPPLLDVKHLELDGLVHAGQRLEHSHVTARLDAEQLAIPRAMLNLPGLTAELYELTLPSPLRHRVFALPTLAGRFRVDLDDLSPHASVLPALLRNALPIRGHLAGAIQHGVLQLDSAELHARGADLHLEQGSLAIAGADWQIAEGSLRFAATFTGFAPTLAALGACTINGRVSGTLAGSMARPRCDMHLDLGECRTRHGGLSSAEGRVLADHASITIAGLQVQGCRLADFVSQAATNVRLDASCRLLDGAIDPDSVVAKTEIQGLLAADLLAPILAEAGLGQEPLWASTLQLHAHHDSFGITVEALRWRTAPGSPVALAIDGAGILPLHWSSAGLLPLAKGALVLHVDIQRTATRPDEPRLALAGELRLDAQAIDLRELTIEVGAARLHAEVGTERGIAAILAGESLAAMPLRGRLHLEHFNLAHLPSAWMGGLHVRGHLSGHVQATGTPSEIEPGGQLTLVDGELAGQGLPSLTGIQLQLVAETGEHPTKALLVAVNLAAALDPDLGIDRNVRFAADIRCDESGTRLAPTVLQLGGGQITMQLASNLRRSDLLARTLHPDELTLSGTLGLRECGLDKVPLGLLGIGLWRGILSGEVEIDGALLPSSALALVRSAKLALHDGEWKAPDLPRLEQLAIELSCDQQVLTLRSLTGKLGAGKLSAQGSLRATGGTLADSIENASLALQLDGDDVLLYRSDGMKVRATLHVTATGTLRAIDIGGKVDLGRGSKYVRRISLVPDLRAQGGETVNEGLRLDLLPLAIGERLNLDVAIKTVQPFEVRTSVFDGDLDILGHVRGKASNPRVEGTMSLHNGLLRFPGANLRVTSGLLTFSRSEPLFPDLLVHAEGRRMGISITMTISGRYDRPQLQISSVPPLTQQELLVLLTTGQLPSTLGERGVEGHARFVGGYLANEVFDAWFGSDSTDRGEGLFDRLTIETGREISKNGTESLLVEYGLSERLGVQIERDAYEDYNLGIVLRFRFR